MNYKYKITPKYVQVVCVNCTKFQYWYKNKDNIDMNNFCVMNGNKKIEVEPSVSDEVNLTFFRSINMNHDLSKHQDVHFKDMPKIDPN